MKYVVKLTTEILEVREKEDDISEAEEGDDILYENLNPEEENKEYEKTLRKL